MAVTRIQFRRGTAASWTLANPILSSGEPGFETDTNKYKIGDGQSTWSQLSYFSGGTSNDASLVHLTGAETVTGDKNFTGALQHGGQNVATVLDIPHDGAAVTASLRTLGTGAQQAMAGNDARVVGAAADTGVVHITGNEAVAGVKTFNNPPIVPAGAFPETAVNNLVSDLAAKEAIANKDTANGYAGLDSGSKLKIAEIPTLDLLPTATANVSMGSHKIINVLNPTAAQDVATKAYVDVTSVGFSPKGAAAALADSNEALSGLLIIDGYQTIDNDVVLLTAQTTGSQNGLWVVHSGAWARPVNFATGSQAQHSLVTMLHGNTYAGAIWQESDTGTVVVDTDAQAWQVFINAANIAVTSPLNLTGNTISIPAGSLTNGLFTDGTLTDAKVNAANKDGVAGTLSLRTLGTGAQQAMAGNDSRVTSAAVDTAVVHNTGAESVSGVKTFLNAPVVPTGSFPENAVIGLVTDLAAKAADSGVVHLTGNETVAGIKTFSSAPVVPSSAFPQAAVVNLTTDLSARALDSAVVHNSGNETVAGIKTFSSAPVVPSNSFPEAAITNLVSDLAAKATDSAVVHNTGAETVAGVKTFSSAPVVPTSSFPEAAITNLVNDLSARELTANKDVANGYAGLDNGGKLKTTEMVRLDQIPVPTASVSMNSQKIISLLNPTSAQDAMTKAFADANYLNLYNGSPEPIASTTIGATTFTPTLASGNRQEVTTTGNPTIDMPTVTSGVKSSWTLRLINNGTGGFGEPTWDAKVTWVGLKSTRAQGANTWDLYYFETVDNTVWWGYHLTALSSHGANYDDWTKMTAPSAPAANNLRQYVDTADTVMKIKDAAGEIHLQEVHVGTTAPTNNAIPWIDSN